MCFFLLFSMRLALGKLHDPNCFFNFESNFTLVCLIPELLALYYNQTRFKQPKEK